MTVRTLLLAALGCGCATSGPLADYHPLQDASGYSESPIPPNRYDVRFVGTATTAPERALELVRRRAAEVTVRDGLPAFYIFAGGIHMRNPDFHGPMKCARGTPPVSFVCSGGPADTGPKVPQAEMIITTLTRGQIAGCGERGVEVYDARAVLDNRGSPVVKAAAGTPAEPCP